jgi:multiple sugar transport system ATP-binding protein
VTGARLSLRGLRVRFGAVAALNGLSLEVEPGEFMVLLGPSGCGKSTLLAAIAGLQVLDSGQVVLDGRDVTRLEPADRDTAIVFQSYALYPTMTVSQNITFGMRMRGVPRAERARRLADIGRLLQLEPLLARRPSQLSGGQQQRVAIGRALVRDPKLFLLDEPLSSLDAPLRLEMRAQIKQLHGRLGTTVVYVTHDQVEAMGMATRIALMHEGSVVQVGEPQDVYDRPATLFAARFVGSPRMNLIPGRLAVHDGSVVGSPGAKAPGDPRDPARARAMWERGLADRFLRPLANRADRAGPAADAAVRGNRDHGPGGPGGGASSRPARTICA